MWPMIGFSNPELSTLVVTGATENKGADKTSWRSKPVLPREGGRQERSWREGTGYIQMGEQETNRVQRGEESGGGSLEQQRRELCSPVPWRQRWWVTGTEEGEKRAGQAGHWRSPAVMPEPWPGLADGSQHGRAPSAECHVVTTLAAWCRWRDCVNLPMST